MLDAQLDLQVVAEPGDGAEAVRAALEVDVDLAILDIAMPGMTGLHAARELDQRQPEIRGGTVSLSRRDDRTDTGIPASRPQP